MAKSKKGGARTLEEIPEGDVEKIGMRRSFTVKGQVILLMGAVLALAEAAAKVADALLEAGYLREEDGDGGQVRVVRHVPLRNGSALIPGAVYPKQEAGARVVHRLQAQGDIYTVQRPTQTKVATPPENKGNAPKPEDDGGGVDSKPEGGQGEGGSPAQGQDNGEGGERGPGEE